MLSHRLSQRAGRTGDFQLGRIARSALDHRLPERQRESGTLRVMPNFGGEHAALAGEGGADQACIALKRAQLVEVTRIGRVLKRERSRGLVRIGFGKAHEFSVGVGKVRRK